MKQLYLIAFLYILHCLSFLYLELEAAVHQCCIVCDRLRSHDTAADDGCWSQGGASAGRRIHVGLSGWLHWGMSPSSSQWKGVSLLCSCIG